MLSGDFKATCVLWPALGRMYNAKTAVVLSLSLEITDVMHTVLSACIAT